MKLPGSLFVIVFTLLIAIVLPNNHAYTQIDTKILPIIKNTLKDQAAGLSLDDTVLQVYRLTTNWHNRDLYGKEDGYEPNEVKYFGPDFTFSYTPIELNVQYLERRDSYPLFYDDYDTDIESRGAMVELVYMPEAEFSTWYAVGLFNWIESDYIPVWVSGYDALITGDYLNYKTVTAHIGYVWRTNIRFFAEYTRDLENEENRVVAGFVTGF